MKKTPWPTKAVMQQIYKQQLWGGNAFDYYSGEGSHKPEIIRPYITEVVDFLRSHNDNLTVCDLGCGDFNVGRYLVEYTNHYYAIDIVPELIERNKTRFKAKHLEFQCLDISKDNLPQADCAILRQVLQHLSNTEIQQILDKLQSYKYIILTEHLPNGSFTPNIDMIANRGNRLKHKSGVDLLKPPFSLMIIKEKILSTFVLETCKERIKTILYTRF